MLRSIIKVRVEDEIQLEEIANTTEAIDIGLKIRN